jgi:phosphoglycolate phosphatase-like HAD superfamily hydrolase
VQHGRPYPAVVFDLDGTLIDSYPAIAASANHVRSLSVAGRACQG